MSLQIQNILENFPDLVTLARGQKTDAISELRDPENATPDSLIFAGDLQHFRAATQSVARAWVVSKAFEKNVPEHVKILLVSTNVPLAIALISKRFFPLTRHHQPIEGDRIHRSAVIAASARLGANCVIG